MTDRVTVLCSDPRNHIWPYLERWCMEEDFTIGMRGAHATGDDLLLLVSCTEVIPAEVRAKYGCTLVIHESALPEGRGWSPFAWQVLEGNSEITVSLLEAADPVDSGDLLLQQVVKLDDSELSDELNVKRDRLRMEMARWAVENFRTANRVKQDGEPTFYARRRAEDSRLDPDATIADQFDLLRICEPRFPAFFDLRGCRYQISLRKVAGEGNVR